MAEDDAHDAHVRDWQRHQWLDTPDFARWCKDQERKRNTYQKQFARVAAAQPEIKAKPHRQSEIKRADKIRALHGQIVQRKRVASRHRASGKTAAAEREETQAAIFEAILQDV